MCGKTGIRRVATGRKLCLKRCFFDAARRCKLVVRGCNVGQARLVRRVGWLGSCNYLGKWAMTDEIDVLQKSLSLKSRITQDGVVVAPGVYDALTASLAASAGFEALYLSGAAIAYTRLGRPDIGLMSSTEVADTLAHLSERVETPIIVDADTGYGNALNVERTVRLFERAGAAAIQLEDQTFPKRCGHLEGKGIVAMHEMVGKIHAAVDARRRTQTLIIARTDAIAGEGFESAIQRAECYFGRGG
jgi:2-methylisocitrate lyase-like PEP mutase family enzyme